MTSAHLVWIKATLSSLAPQTVCCALLQHQQDSAAETLPGSRREPEHITSAQTSMQRS